MTAPARAHQLLDELFDVLRDTRDEWVDQTNSPLGRDRHLTLARNGTLPSSKDRRRVLILRSVIDAYLVSKKRIVKIEPEVSEEREVEQVISKLKRGQR